MTQPISPDGRQWLEAHDEARGSPDEGGASDDFRAGWTAGARAGVKAMSAVAVTHTPPPSALDDALKPSPIGRNAKLNELIMLAAISAAQESGQGYDQSIFKKHADHAARLWEQHLDAT